MFNLFNLFDIKYIAVSVVLIFIVRRLLFSELAETSKKTNTIKDNKDKKMVSAAVVNNIKQLISSSKILVAHKSYCPYCHATLKTLLSDKKIAEKDIKLLELDSMDNGAEIQDAFYEISGQRTVPNIYIGGKHIGGNSDLDALNRSGELDTLLKSVLSK